jgi:malate dehydrogenase (oxaloacetate-decarboxylating)
MARNVDRPLIFPLSNPTSRSEAAPADILRWTDGRAIVGTGSPFPPVVDGGRTVPIDQVNNSYVFPGIGLGVIAARAARVTETMFLAASRALAELSPARDDPGGTLLPPVSELRRVARHVAIRVVEQARREGLAGAADGDPAALVDARIWEPVYHPYEPA